MGLLFFTIPGGTFISNSSELRHILQDNRLKFSSGWFQPISPVSFPGTKLLFLAMGRAGLLPDYPIAEAQKTITATHCANICLYYQGPDTDFWDVTLP